MTQNSKNQANLPTFSSQELAKKIDHTLLKPVLLMKELEKLCAEARQYEFKTVCIPPSWVVPAVDFLKGSSVETITVVGFPLGYSLGEAKAFEASKAIEQGAGEIDMVANVSFLKNGMLRELEADIALVKKACGKIPLKVIIETAYLSTAEKITVATIAEQAGADFVKTSTGFAVNPHPENRMEMGATLADIELLRKTLKPGTRIKASGGIRDFAMAVAMIHAGADRLGTSAGVTILNGLKNESGY